MQGWSQPVKCFKVQAPGNMFVGHLFLNSTIDANKQSSFFLGLVLPSRVVVDYY
jgi:hypothetical protein